MAYRFKPFILYKLRQSSDLFFSEWQNDNDVAFEAIWHKSHQAQNYNLTDINKILEVVEKHPALISTYYNVLIKHLDEFHMTCIIMKHPEHSANIYGGIYDLLHNKRKPTGELNESIIRQYCEKVASPLISNLRYDDQQLVLYANGENICYLPEYWNNLNMISFAIHTYGKVIDLMPHYMVTDELIKDAMKTYPDLFPYVANRIDINDLSYIRLALKNPINVKWIDINCINIFVYLEINPEIVKYTTFKNNKRVIQWLYDNNHIAIQYTEYDYMLDDVIRKFPSLYNTSSFINTQNAERLFHIAYESDPFHFYKVPDTLKNDRELAQRCILKNKLMFPQFNFYSDKKLAMLAGLSALEYLDPNLQEDKEIQFGGKVSFGLCDIFIYP